MVVATPPDRSWHHLWMEPQSPDTAGQARAQVAEIVALLGLESHPEGGRYAETWRAPAADGQRPAGTAIYFLLTGDERSHWHRVDAAEVWHHYAGAPLLLRTADRGTITSRILGTDLAAGERPQLVVAAGEWQAAETMGSWTLVGCTVAPGFEFSGFELAPPGWSPETGR